MVLRICAGISVFVGFFALQVSVPVALPLIIIGGAIMFLGDYEKEEKEKQVEDNKVYKDMVADMEKRGLYNKNPKKFNYTKNKNNV